MSAEDHGEMLDRLAQMADADRNLRDLSPNDRAAIECALRLIRSAVRTADRSNGGIDTPRWAAVMRRFALGSTSAKMLCRWADHDPDELMLGVFADDEDDSDEDEEE